MDSTPSPLLFQDDHESLRRALVLLFEYVARCVSLLGSHSLIAMNAEDEDKDERQCRICFDGSESGRLIRPCRCRGSIAVRALTGFCGLYRMWTD